MDSYRQTKIFNLVMIVQWVIIALLLVYTQLPFTSNEPLDLKPVYWFLVLAVLYALAYTKLPKEIYCNSKFFYWTSLLYQFSIAYLVYYTGGIDSDLHWLFLLPILFISSYYGMYEGLFSAFIATILLAFIYMVDPQQPALTIFLHIYIRRVAVFWTVAFFTGLFANESISERTELATFRDLSSSQQLSTTADLNILLEQINQNLLQYINADVSCLMLLDADKKHLVIRSIESTTNDINGQNKRIIIGEGIAGQVAKTQIPLFVQDTTKVTQFKPQGYEERLRSMLSVPLRVQNTLIGVLSVGRFSSKKFKKDDLRKLSALAGEASVSIHNTQLFTQLQEMHLDIIKSLTAAIEAKDPYTRGHSEEVTKYAMAIAKRLDLSWSEIETLKTASLLHDIGKLGIKEDILLKTEELNAEEWAIIQTHPNIGIRILGSCTTLHEAIPLILYHHERYDGSGYPVGLKGENIPLGSRILAVADSFEAMISNRPYRNALSLKEAINELNGNAGSQFDPYIVQIFVELILSDKSLQKRIIKNGKKSKVEIPC